MTPLEQLKFLLRKDHRIKDSTDYAITFKYDKFHLLCADPFLDAIVAAGQRFDIRFATVSTYSP